MRKIACAFRRATGEHDDIACVERLAHRKLKRTFIVGKRAKSYRLAAGFGNCRSQNGAIAVIDASRARPAGPAQSTRPR